MNIQTWLKNSIEQLKHAGIASARLDALLLLENELEKDREWVLAHDEQSLSSTSLTSLNKKITLRTKRVPLAYIINHKEFFSRNFYIDKSVLIPRPESEAIIELLLEAAQVDNLNTVFDIGTGSGCLAITTKLELPELHVTASDISSNALKVARRNARELSANVNFKKADLLVDLPKMPQTRPFVVVANLPYVPEGLITSQEITKEPPEALFSDRDGLDHYRRLWQQLADLKQKPLYVITESLVNQHMAMTTLAQTANYTLEKTSTLAQLFKLNQ